MSRSTRRPAADRERFEEIYASTRLPLLGYLVRRSESVEDAADLLAEVYLVAWRRITDVPPGDEARLWLFGVARRVLANHHRRGRNETELAVALEAVLRVHGNAGQTPADSGGELEGAVADALATLRPADRELVMLNAWDELSPAGIGLEATRRRDPRATASGAEATAGQARRSVS
jgi:DNA-directed RNA polymerase specialized sigma24 family protein